MLFKNRFDAAHELCTELTPYTQQKDCIILAIPRGGLQIGHVLSEYLHCPLDIILTKKIGYPGHKEFAIGSVSLSSVCLNEDYSRQFHNYIQDEIISIRQKLRQHYALYLGNRKPTSLKDKLVIITDDGVATGHTLLSAIDLVRQESPRSIVCAVPVGAPDSIQKILPKVDKIICLHTPSSFSAVGQFYDDFSQVSDQDVIDLLNKSTT
ncbi:phosphoribosyltransferase [Candidatus Marinamargulisbacteria bacterium SCGC AG-343-D04]|nr:phosphoribosyltransferase [Candidatus Marinamargulisbacteria bacterium SCGC AG-343-D04]